MFCLQFSKEYLNYFFGGQGGGLNLLTPPPLIYALVYSAQKKQYHVTAVCKLRCTEVMFVIK